MKRRWIIIFSLSLLGAQKGYNDAFQSLGTTTRMASLGQAVVADYGHIGAWIMNPAAIAGGFGGQKLYGTYIHQFGMAEYMSAGVLNRQNTGWRWGLFVVGVAVDDILARPDLRTITDLETRRDSIRALVARGFRSFHDREASLSFTFSRRFHWSLDLGWMLDDIPLDIPLGLNLHLIKKSLDQIRGAGLGGDVGGMIIFRLSDIIPVNNLGRLALGMTVKQVAGTRIFWNTKRQDLIPQQIVTGYRYSQSLGFQSVAVHVYQQYNWQYNERDYGMEINTGHSISLFVGSRAGYYQGGMEIDLKGLGFSGTLGYGFSNHEFGMIHRFGLSWSRTQ